MKTQHVYSCLVGVLMFCIIGQGPVVLAQDPAQAGPSIYKLKLQNKKVRVFEVTFKPGQKIGLHAHPDHVVYVLSTGTLKISEPGKKPVTLTGKVGDTFYLPAQKHAAQNVGKTTIKLLVVELRPMPKLASALKKQ